MARTTRWTDEKLKTVKPDDGKSEQRKLVDAGLYLHIRPKADGTFSRIWQYRAQVDGVRRWLSLGAFPAVGLAKAKEEMLVHGRAHEAAKKGEGDHPVIAARFARKEARSLPTVQDVFDEWVADKRIGSKKKQGVPVRERTIDVLTQNYVKDIKGKIGDAKVAKLTRNALQACVDAPRKRGAPGAAAQVYRTLRGLVNFAIVQGYVDGADPMRGMENPKPYRPAPVNAATDAELVAMLDAVDASQLWQCTKLLIEFQLLTGARPTEARLATWSELNFDRRTWRIPAERVKSGREFTVHLSEEACVVLKRAAALRDLGSEFVFQGASGKALEKMAVARALSRLATRTHGDGGKKLRPHDLRRTFRTMLSRLGIQPHVGELCMNHQETETMRRVYDGYDYFPEMVDAWDRIGAHIGSLRSGGAQVISIRAA